ncbi:hypothetical protein VDG1235_3765 [Verrucomicrobiia bacterium DG1235]|nr:hypothetical protein VDG1235_3765 [Verrucomicrobiae bacterium DG1235]
MDSSNNASNQSRLSQLYDQVNGEEETRLCLDIPDAACRHLPRNYFAYLAANVLSKIADELSSARLVLPWLFSAMGAPLGLIGYIVPLREAGVLIPQLAIAAYLRRLAQRKYAWLAGAALSGIALLAVGILSPTLGKQVAGYTTLGLLLVYSMGRGVCSVAAKDVIGKTVSKKRRGALMGYSAGISSAAILCIGLGISFAQNQEANNKLPFLLILAAGALWFASLACFQAIKEEAGSTEGGRSAWDAVWENLALLKTDPVFRHYLLARGLLLSVALAPPFYALMAQQRSENAGDLGWLIIAGGLAGTISGPFWGKASDRSSRLTMAFAALMAGLLGIGIGVFDLFSTSGWTSQSWIYAALFFTVNLFYGGARLGRKAYLVDMTSGDKSGYVAIGNTLTGIALLVLGSLGFLADSIGPSGAIASLGVLSLIGSLVCWRLKEVSG